MKNRIRTTVQLSFLLISLVIAAIWCDEMARAHDNWPLAVMAFLCLCAMLVWAAVKRASDDPSVGAVWIYGLACAALLASGIYISAFNISAGQSSLLGGRLWSQFVSSPGLVSVYHLLMDSWLFAMLHAAAFVLGGISFFAALRDLKESIR